MFIPLNRELKLLPHFPGHKRVLDSYLPQVVLGLDIVVNLGAARINTLRQVRQVLESVVILGVVQHAVRDDALNLLFVKLRHHLRV